MPQSQSSNISMSRKFVLCPQISQACGNGFGDPESGIVMPNGDVYLCCMDWALEYKLGNLLEQSWLDVMASDVRKRGKEDRETGCHNGICRHCAEAVMDYRG